MKLFVIESLRTNDKQTGTNLYNDLIRLQLDVNSCKLYTPHCKSDLDADLKDILLTTNSEDTIFIHFEMHGCGSGLEIQNDLYQYTEIREHLRKINKKCNCGLYVTFAVCEGLRIMLEEDFLKKTMPYCGIVASQEKISECEIEEFFYTLYSEIIEYKNLEIAFPKTKENTSCCKSMRFIKPNDLFCRSWNNYLSSLQRKKTEKILIKSLSKIYNQHEAPIRAKIMLESTLQKEYDERKKIFYMLDSIDVTKQTRKFDIKNNYKDIPKYEITY